MAEEEFVQIIDDDEGVVQVLGYEPSTSEEGEIEVSSFELDGDSAVIIDIDDEPSVDFAEDTSSETDIDTFTADDIQ